MYDNREAAVIFTFSPPSTLLLLYSSNIFYGVLFNLFFGSLMILRNVPLGPIRLSFDTNHPYIYICESVDNNDDSNYLSMLKCNVEKKYGK